MALPQLLADVGIEPSGPIVASEQIGMKPLDDRDKKLLSEL